MAERLSDHSNREFDHLEDKILALEKNMCLKIDKEVTIINTKLIANDTAMDLFRTAVDNKFHQVNTVKEQLDKFEGRYIELPVHALQLKSLESKHNSDIQLVTNKLETERKTLSDKLEVERKTLADKMESEKKVSDDKINNLSRLIYIGIGLLMAVELLLRFIIL